ncbi:hypothetical protein EB796_019049 [Bugula neritina]|uniref:Uncharacterized protein n=1 Tax=Bugula neritina TaxID=10212 RepID=A0A7J7JAD1_BUGNE|nr:hypothetical protein EB796_019049 [Bugula neritina]
MPQEPAQICGNDAMNVMPQGPAQISRNGTQNAIPQEPAPNPANTTEQSGPQKSERKRKCPTYLQDYGIEDTDYACSLMANIPQSTKKL